MQSIMRALVVRDPTTGQEKFVRIIWDPLNGGDPKDASTHDAVTQYVKEYCGNLVYLSDGIIDNRGRVPEDFQGLVCNMMPMLSNPTDRKYELLVLRFDLSTDENALARRYRNEAERFKRLEADDPPDFSSARDPVIIKGTYTDDFFDIFFAAFGATLLSVLLVWIGHLLFSNNDDEASH